MYEMTRYKLANKEQEREQAIKESTEESLRVKDLKEKSNAFVYILINKSATAMIIFNVIHSFTHSFRLMLD